jgi:hypothetical protein
MMEKWKGGVKEEWKDERMAMTIRSFPIIPTFHHSNLPHF